MSLLRTLSAVALAAQPACGLAHRHARFFGPDQFAWSPDEGPARVQVMLEAEEEIRPATPDAMQDREGRTLLRPVVVGDRDTLVVTPTGGPVEVRLYTRGHGLLDRHDFRRLHTVSGSLPRRFPSEVVFLPEQIDGPLRVAVADLSNPYNSYRFAHGDLLVVEAHDASGSERTMYRKRDTGLHWGGFGGVLATIPLDPDASVAPILAGGPTVGWRTRRSSGPWMAFDTVELVVSFGIGSTALDAVVDETGVEDRLSGLFDAALAGAGLRVFRLVTVQGFLNTSQFLRDRPELPVTLGVGFDARGVAVATRDMFGKLLRESPVRERP